MGGYILDERGERRGWTLTGIDGQVTYFKKWRVQELQKKARLKELEAQGAVKMDVNAQFTERR